MQVRISAGETLLQQEQRLADRQNELDGWRWMDGSPICGKSFLMHTFGVAFDHKKLRHSEDCEWWCNDPKLCVVIPISDSLANLKYVQGFVVRGWGLLSEPITLLDGTELRLRVRFLKGDAPIQQKASGCSTGGATYRCWLCDAWVRLFVELDRCASDATPRDLASVAQAATRAMRAPGCDGHIAPRELRVAGLRGLLRAMGQNTGGGGASLLQRAIDALKGVNSYPMLLLSELGGDLHALRSVECAADVALHVLKGLANALRGLVGKSLGKEQQHLWAKAIKEVVDKDDGLSCSDERMLLAAMPRIWTATLSSTDTPTSTIVDLRAACHNLALATEAGIRAPYTRWHAEYPKVCIRTVCYIYQFTVHLRRGCAPGEKEKEEPASYLPALLPPGHRTRVRLHTVPVLYGDRYRDVRGVVRAIACDREHVHEPPDTEYCQDNCGAPAIRETI